jgi:hypothetical protein
VKDKITILCVEDGSVDVDNLTEDSSNGKVLIYRQGSQPPFVLEVDKPDIPFITYEKWLLLKDYVESLTLQSGYAQVIFSKMKEIESGRSK